jgi:hypothetical protein
MDDIQSHHAGIELNRESCGGESQSAGGAHRRAADALRDQRLMKQVIDRNALIQRFNEDEAVWQICERIRELRRMLGADSILSDTVLEEIDRLEAEREHRQTRCIGTPLP